MQIGHSGGFCDFARPQQGTKASSGLFFTELPEAGSTDDQGATQQSKESDIASKPGVAVAGPDATELSPFSSLSV